MFSYKYFHFFSLWLKRYDVALGVYCSIFPSWKNQTLATLQRAETRKSSSVLFNNINVSPLGHCVQKPQKSTLISPIPQSLTHASFSLPGIFPLVFIPVFLPVIIPLQWLTNQNQPVGGRDLVFGMGIRVHSHCADKSGFSDSLKLTCTRYPFEWEPNRYPVSVN